MDTYVFSRGFDQNFDYCWLKLTEEIQERVNELPTPFAQDTNNLIYSDSFSILISRRENQLFFLITALKPENRFDFTGIRQIIVSVAWVGVDSADNELLFRMLATQALNDEGLSQITQIISQAVTLGGQYGFQADLNLLNSLLDLDKAKEVVQDSPLNGYGQVTHKLAKLSPIMKSKLADELLRFRLPKGSLSLAGCPLVVVTEIKKEETLREALVWRGLSNLVEHNDWWTYYPPAKPVGEILWFIMQALFKLKKEWGIGFRAILESVFLNSGF